MIPPQSILTTWQKFDSFPMETLSKVWFYTKRTGKKQRDISLMKEHRSQYGVSGNCFDLALWFLDECERSGIAAYPVGHNLNTEHAHVAVIAVDDSGKRYLCDLGDQWLRPVLVDTDSEDYTEEKLGGFFPGAKVQVRPAEKEVEIYYHRPNGKISKQTFTTQPIEKDYFLQAAEFSQNLIKPRPLLECRVPYQSEIAHWEFCNWESFLSTNEGLYKESKIDNINYWVEKINEKTGYDKEFLVDALGQYRALSPGTLK